MKTKRFALRDVLTVTTGRLLTKSNEHGNGIEAVYELLGWMTDDQPFTHQLPRLGKECKPWLLKWFPELAALETEVNESCDRLQGTNIDAKIDDFMHAIGERIGRYEFDVPRIPVDGHKRKSPVEELQEMTDKPVVVVQI